MGGKRFVALEGDIAGDVPATGKVGTRRRKGLMYKDLAAIR